MSAFQGNMILPGAPFAPVSVWQLLQAPVGGDAAMARVTPLFTTLTVNGDAKFAVESKLPTLFTVRVVTLPWASVTTTVAPPPLVPSQSSGSCAVGYTVPAMLKP